MYNKILSLGGVFHIKYLAFSKKKRKLLSFTGLCTRLKKFSLSFKYNINAEPLTINFNVFSPFIIFLKKIYNNEFFSIIKSKIKYSNVKDFIFKNISLLTKKIIKLVHYIRYKKVSSMLKSSLIYGFYALSKKFKLRKKFKI